MTQTEAKANPMNQYKDREMIQRVLKAIDDLEINKSITIMEVCGGHTMAIHKHGIPALLPKTMRLISGPGCPVCVTDIGYIDRAVAISKLENTILCTYGDLIRVPGSSTSLRAQRSQGRDIRIVYSTLDALKIAEKNPNKKIIFLGIGFETTTPASAAALLEARQKGMNNFFVYSSHKIMQPAMEALAQGDLNLTAYLCPGHVSTVTGTNIYRRTAAEFGVPCVVTGFEPLDIINGVYHIAKQVKEGRSEVEIAYKRAVKPQGNTKAWNLIWEVFEPVNAHWRGIGTIPQSGLALKKAFEEMDAEKAFPVEVEEPKEHKGCICGTILKGMASPKNCPLFEKVCNPANPVGACMVSSEGCCAAYYKYNRGH